MSETTRLDDWLKRAYRLAFFIHGDAETARQITVGAMNKLEVASNAQFKRNYYTPTGRSDAARASRSRVSMSDLQLLQRLVYAESERFERDQESAKKISETRLLVHFVKHLVRVSLKRNSFYATLAVMRILHAYSTSETTEVFNIVVQDPERVHDDYYFRSRKAQLMKELKSRFGELLACERGNRGEERFAAREPSQQEVERVRECLAQFTPWASQCVLPEKISPFDEAIKPLAFNGTEPDAEHRIEVNRIHTILHQSCLERIIAALSFSPTAERLAIPKFVMEHENQNTSDDWRNPPSLTDDELRSIKDILAAQAAHRKAAGCGSLRVLVDGNEQARIDLNETNLARFELDGSAELIEVSAVEQTGDVLLATHVLSFDELSSDNLTQAVTLEGGQKVSFQIQPVKDAHGEIVGASCGVKYEETALARKAALAWRRLNLSIFSNARSWVLNPAFVSALLLFAVVIGVLIYQSRGTANGPQLVKQPQPAPLPARVPGEQLPEIPKSVPPKEEKPVNRNENGPREIQKPNRRTESKPKASPETPAPQVEPDVAPPQPQIASAPEIYRIPLRATAGVSPERDRPTVRRGQRPFRVGTKLGDVRFLYVEVVGDEEFGKHIVETLQQQLSGNRIIITENPELADAALKISVRPEFDGEQSEKVLVSAVVRVVNANGFVIYPTRKNVTGWKYIGRAADLPPRIVQDLVAATSSARAKEGAYFLKVFITFSG